MAPAFWIVLAVVGIAAGIALVWRPLSVARREARFAEACRNFHRQRERLEAKFVQLGAIGAKSDGPKPDAPNAPNTPNAPKWTDCFFDDDVAYARNRSTGELSAFVAVTIEMDDREPRSSLTPDLVGNLRSATAVFRFDGHHWDTDGRAIFNLTPTEAIHFYQRYLEMVGREVAHRP
jgi:hypothetical protein